MRWGPIITWATFAVAACGSFDSAPEVKGDAGTDGGTDVEPGGDAPGPDDTDGSSNVMAARPDRPGMRGSGERVVDRFSEADVMNRDAEIEDGPAGQGADAATNPAARDDDSFAGEVSSSEASGENDAR